MRFLLDERGGIVALKALFVQSTQSDPPSVVRSHFESVSISQSRLPRTTGSRSSTRGRRHPGSNLFASHGGECDDASGYDGASITVFHSHLTVFG